MKANHYVLVLVEIMKRNIDLFHQFVDSQICTTNSIKSIIDSSNILSLSFNLLFKRRSIVYNQIYNQSLGTEISLYNIFIQNDIQIIIIKQKRKQILQMILTIINFILFLISVSNAIQMKKQYSFISSSRLNNHKLRLSLTSMKQAYSNKLISLFQSDPNQPSPFYRNLYIERIMRIINKKEKRENLNIFKLIKQWNQGSFQMNNVQNISKISYSISDINQNNFQSIPFHYLVYAFNHIKQDNANWTQISNKISQTNKKIMEIYPPSNANQSMQILQYNFDVIIQNNLEWNLFQNSQITNIQTLFREIDRVNEKATDQYQQFRKQMAIYCKNGKYFKSGQKIGSQALADLYRVYIRIIQKILGQQIRQKIIIDNIKQNIKQNYSLTNYIKVMLNQWEIQINKIVKSKYGKNQKIIFKVTDLIRAKCQFSSFDDLKKTVKRINEDQQSNLTILNFNNRLNNGTKDVVFNFKINGSVGQLQLALQFDETLNDFNHALYQIKRTPEGSIFGSLMWLSKLDKFTFLDKMIKSQLDPLHINYLDYTQNFNKIRQVYLGLNK